MSKLLFIRKEWRSANADEKGAVGGVGGVGVVGAASLQEMFISADGRAANIVANTDEMYNRLFM